MNPGSIVKNCVKVGQQRCFINSDRSPTRRPHWNKREVTSVTFPVTSRFRGVLQPDTAYF